jgi:glycolate oxidase iron-sulfur subunit
VLAELEPRAARGAVPLKAAYHDACHLQHAQGVRAQPRRLLQAIPGVTVREIGESEICCGSAGIYNLLEPEAAAQLRDRKVQNILKTDAEAIISSNPGCLLQISTGLEAAGRPMRIMHLVEVLDRSIREGERAAIRA